MSDPASIEPSRASLVASSWRSTAHAELLRALDARSAQIGVIGLGHVGLPLAEAFCRAGFPVVGFDVDARKIERLRRGESHNGSLASSWILDAVASARFRVTNDFSELEQVAAILLCVPTPLTAQLEPDLSFIRETAEQVARHLRPGKLVVLESTTYPGTTDEVVKPILERGGLVAGRDFFLAYAPEREDPGNKAYPLWAIPRVVGGVDLASRDVAEKLYAAAIETVVPVSSARVAEASKILENIYRAVNIALVNELKMLFDEMEIDIWEVIAASATKPFGFQPFYPGPGLGGHCIPIDPFYLTWKAREFGVATRLIELAGEINRRMPNYVVDRTAEAMNARRKPLRSSRGLLLGLAYKPNLADVRESPAFRILELLEERGAELGYYDPCVRHLPDQWRQKLRAKPADLDEATLRAMDFVVIVTDHDGIDWRFVVRNAPLIIDTRNATRDVIEGREKIVRA